MKLWQYFYPVMEMPELARFPERVRHLIVTSARLQTVSLSLFPGACVLGILGGMASGLLFTLICFGVFSLLVLAYWHFGIVGFFSSLLGALVIIGFGAAVSRLVYLHKMRKQICAYLRSDVGQEITRTFGSS